MAKTSFKAPEGRYEIVAERPPGPSPPSTARPTRLTLARPTTGPLAGADLVIFNAGDAVHVCRLGEVDQPPIRSITFPPLPSGMGVLPLCHAWRPLSPVDAAAGAPDLLVGLTSGGAVALSLAAQLDPAVPAAARAVASEALPPPAGVGEVPANVGPASGPAAAAAAAAAAAGRRCVSVAWAPDGCAVAALAAGYVSWHAPPFRLAITAPPPPPPAGGPVIVIPSGGGPAKAPSSPSGPPPRPGPTRTLAAAVPAGLAAAALSPDGRLLATAGRDGVCRVHDVSPHGDGALVTGFKSYFGGLLSVAWSPDGAALAAGGEDDTACVFSLADRGGVGWADGADAWVSAVAFDPHAEDAAGGGSGGSGASATPATPPPPSGGLAPPPPPTSTGERVYRLGVASQDCGLALHDVAVPDAAFAAGLPPLSPRGGGGGGGGGGGSPGHGGWSPFSATAAAPACGSSPSTTAFGTPGPPSSAGGGGGGGATGGGATPESAGAAEDGGGGEEGGGGRRAPRPPPPPRGNPLHPPPLPPEITPAPPSAEMPLVPAIARARAHTEPLSDVAFAPGAVVTACCAGSVRVWARPGAAGAALRGNKAGGGRGSSPPPGGRRPGGAPSRPPLSRTGSGLVVGGQPSAAIPVPDGAGVGVGAATVQQPPSLGSPDPMSL